MFHLFKIILSHLENRTLLYLDSKLLALLQERIRSQFDSNGQLLVQGTDSSSSSFLNALVVVDDFSGASFKPEVVIEKINKTTRERIHLNMYLSSPKMDTHTHRIVSENYKLVNEFHYLKK